jgi:hypothetical protein
MLALKGILYNIFLGKILQLTIAPNLETLQESPRRGGSLERIRKAKHLECKSTGKFNTVLFLKAKNAIKDYYL